MNKFLRGAFWFVLVMAGLFVVINWQFFAVRTSFWWSQLTSQSSEVASSEIKGQPDMIAIPSLGIEAPLVYVEATDETTFQAGLALGVVHYPSTAKPGEYGNAFFFGHSSDFPTKPGNYKTVFALLPEIEPGAVIEITDRYGRLYIYEVFDQQIVSPNQTEFLEQGDRDKKILTLQTSYPVGTALRRYIVQAEAI